MNPFTAFHRGIRRALRTGRLAVYTWLAGFLFSLLWVIPVGSFLHGNYGRSPLWQAMGDGFSWTWLGDAIFRHGDLPALIVGGLLAMAAGWLLLNVYLNGGLIAGLVPPRRHFLRDCGEHFPRLLRLFLLSLPVYLVAILGAALLAELLRALNPDPVTEWGELWRQWVRWGLLAAALAAVNLVFDLAKIALVRRPDGKAWRALGEVVFNTSMTGYQEVLTDPSYCGQIMTFTCPHIGNVGCNGEDVESGRIWVEGVIIRNLAKLCSNFRAESTLPSYLEASGIMGICGIDTRSLVLHIRTHGAQMGAMACGSDSIGDTLVDIARAHGHLLGKDYVADVSCKKPYSWERGEWMPGQGFSQYDQQRLSTRPHAVALDCGIKRNILNLLTDSGFRVTVAPAFSTAEELLSLCPDALFLSNGPGDPSVLRSIVSEMKKLIGRLPIFGICLGHQILGQVFGGETYKLKFGHRGANHPVKNVLADTIEITSQNHGYAVDAASLPKDVTVSHLNLNDMTVEGLSIPEARTFSVQYHPEASPGPHDPRYLFRQFFEMVVG